MRRVLTAALLIPVMIGTVLWLPAPALSVVLAIVAGVAAWEWGGLGGPGDWRGRLLYPAALLPALFLAEWLRQRGFLPWMVAAGLLWWLYALHVVIGYQRGTWHGSANLLRRFAWCFMVLVPAWISLVGIRSEGAWGIPYLLFLFVLIWIADSAAYFAGRRYGRRRLADRVSSGKTVEGVLAALLAGIAAGLGYAVIMKLRGMEIIAMLIISAFTVLMSVLGDLAESLVKREASVKDSGSWLPGHGGVLDRIDSLTAAAPVYLAGLWCLERLP